MNEGTEKCRSWLWKLLILMLLCGLIAWVAIPNFVGHSQYKANYIINNLRQIGGAKNQWAFDHGITNSDQITGLTNQLSEQDLSPYLGFFSKENRLVPSVAGEIYVINPLNKSPEAKLVHKIDKPWPIGSIIRFSEKPKVNAYLEIIFPDGTKTNY
jgi:hypothetical protein